MVEGGGGLKKEIEKEAHGLCCSCCVESVWRSSFAPNARQRLVAPCP